MTSTPPIRFRLLTGTLLGEILIGGGLLYGMDGLAHLRLQVGTFLFFWSSVALALVGAAIAGAGWRRTAAQAGLIALAGFVVNAAAGLRLSAGQLAYFAGLVALSVGFYRMLLGQLKTAGHGGWAEPLRVVAAGAAGFGVIFPFATDHFMGGGDAHWYGMMMGDFLEQARAGVFPIFTGQGELAFNGGIHPFRSAPLHLWLGGLLDILTLRGLSVLAVQHLTALVSSVAATLAMYLALTSLNPSRRWTAVGVTVIFSCCPGQLAAIYASEAYMTFMAFPWVVVTLWGNALTFGPAQKQGWWLLVVGLALTWLAHPSVGVWAAIASVLLQLAWFVAHGRTPRELATAVAAMAIFSLLTLGYFVAVSEIMPARLAGSGRALLFAGGVAALMLTLWAMEGRRWSGAMISAVVAVGVLWWIRPAMGIFGLLVTGLYFVTLTGRLRLSWLAGRERRLEWMLGLLLASGFLAALIVGKNFPGKGSTTDYSLGVEWDALRHALAPVPSDAVSLGDFQPGWAMVALFGCGILGCVLSRAVIPRVLALTAIVVALMYVPLPYLAEFFWGNLPDEVVTLTSIAFDRRILPVLIPLAAFAGFLGLGAIPRPGLQRGAVFLLAMLLPWSGWEAAKFVRRGFAIRSTWEVTKNFYRKETAVLSRYAYDLLPMPAYVSHGLVDFRFETRILNDGDFSERFGPAEYARLMEQESARDLLVTGKTSQPGSAWLALSPPLEIAPGEDWVLDFHFAPHLPAGYLILQSLSSLYREYLLPSSGYGKSFGWGAGNNGVITLQNTGSVPEHYIVEYQRTGRFDPGEGEGEFARVTISRFDAAVLPVRVTSLLPYRAVVQLERAGWLETFRCWLPGYVAVVDGHPVAVRESPDHLVMLPLAAGFSNVEVRYAGTVRLWAALWISALTWAAMLGVGLVSGLRKLTR